jgi:hypothetical protein
MAQMEHPGRTGLGGLLASDSPDWRQHRTAGLLIAAAAAAVVLLVVLINVVHSNPPAASASSASSSAASAMTGMPGSSSSGTTGATTGSSSTAIPTINGGSLPVMQTSGAMLPTAMAMVPVGTANWDGMTIAARTSAPATFVLFDNGSQQDVKPTAKTSFHLMVLLSDASTGVSIPYSSVWATVTKGGKKIFDEELWPMISRYMGPHYGNNVSLPSAGVYHLTLLVSPPEAARHLEYNGLWLQPHRVSMTFRWVPKT